jgi:putative sigma-54 modulation protein
MVNINFQVRAPNFQDTTKDYFQNRINNLEKLLGGYESLMIRVESVSNTKSRYVQYKVAVTLKMPHAFIKVSETGRNINNVFDKLLGPLEKKLARYHSQDERWGKHKEWKLRQESPTESTSESGNVSHYENYEPVFKRKFFDDDTPLHPAEAVEKMELLGHDSFLFKNIENSRYGMIYRRKKGGYGIVQPII